MKSVYLKQQKSTKTSYLQNTSNQTILILSQIYLKRNTRNLKVVGIKKALKICGQILSRFTKVWAFFD